MTRLRGARGAMAREMFVQLLRDHGPMTNYELAELANTEADLFVFTWSIYPHMRKLEDAGCVRRLQLGPRCTILWAVVE